ncbi:TetR/AcrR family transcriptional regulator [Kitasatospora sp. NPDC018058]|uniref:TetR/AcrR family transcriptional regulator n=1 Tax=Kitasatospora sp. NPDC018058 TaxID=3364025 RepID=UPI0037C08B41
MSDLQDGLKDPSVGRQTLSSVYHHFGDRDQVDAELLRRHLAALRERIAARPNGHELRTVRDTVDAVIDPLLAHGRRNPAFVQLWREQTAPLVELGREFDESLAEKTLRVLVDRALIRPGPPLLAVQLAFEAGDRLFDVAFERSRRGDAATVDEARRLVTAHLETYAPPAPGDRPDGRTGRLAATAGIDSASARPSKSN